MPTSKKDIIIPQSGHYRIIITVYGGPSSLTGYTGEMQIRMVKSDPIEKVDLDASCFTVDDLNRQVIVDIPSAATELYDWAGRAVYDVYLVSPGGERWRLIEGMASLSKTVTRDEA